MESGGSGNAVTFREDRVWREPAAVESSAGLRATQSDNVLLSRGMGMHPPPPSNVYRRAPTAGLYKTLPRRPG